MKEESAIRIAAAQESKPEASALRSRRTRRRPVPPSAHGPGARFFLSKGEGNGVPLLEREFRTESEALIESLKTGKSYFVISEWRGTADCSKAIPKIGKEPITAKSS